MNLQQPIQNNSRPGTDVLGARSNEPRPPTGDGVTTSHVAPLEHLSLFYVSGWVQNGYRNRIGIFDGVNPSQNQLSSATFPTDSIYPPLALAAALLVPSPGRFFNSLVKILAAQTDIGSAPDRRSNSSNCARVNRTPRVLVLLPVASLGIGSPSAIKTLYVAYRRKWLTTFIASLYLWRANIKARGRHTSEFRRHPLAVSHSGEASVLTFWRKYV